MGEQLALGLQQPCLRAHLRERDLVRGAIPLCLQARDHLPCLDDLLPGGSFPRWRWSPCQGARGSRLSRETETDLLFHPTTETSGYLSDIDQSNAGNISRAHPTL